MTITIPTITALPTPPQKSDSANFPSRADAFVVAQDNMADELNLTIIEMNKLVGGLDQQSTIAAYAAGTTYNFPDVVAYTDGNSYRCVDNGVVGITPGTDVNSWIVISANGVELAADIAAVEVDVTALEALVGGGVLGVGQTWQDVLASRSASVVYTNNTGKPIMVSVRIKNSGTVGGNIKVDGVTAINVLDRYAATWIAVSLTTVVPAGSTYEVSVTYGSIDMWAELR